MGWSPSPCSFLVGYLVHTHLPVGQLWVGQRPLAAATSRVTQVMQVVGDWHESPSSRISVSPFHRASEGSFLCRQALVCGQRGKASGSRGPWETSVRCWGGAPPVHAGAVFRFPSLRWDEMLSHPGCHTG